MPSVLDAPETTTVAEVKRAVLDGDIDEAAFFVWFRRYEPERARPRTLGRRNKRIKRPGQTIMARMFNIGTDK